VFCNFVEFFSLKDRGCLNSVGAFKYLLELN
jgi:hypothetical protein